MSSNLKSGLKIVQAQVEDYKRLIFPSFDVNSTSVSLLIYPKDELLLGIPESKWVVFSTLHFKVSFLNEKNNS